MRLSHGNGFLTCALSLGVAAALSIGSIAGCGANRAAKKSGTPGESADRASGQTDAGTVQTERRGGETFATIGEYMDALAKELGRIDLARYGVRMERISDEIKITWDMARLFDLDSAMLTYESQRAIEKMAYVFMRYPDTEIVITAYSYSDNPKEFGRKLAERRAFSIRDSFVDHGVAPASIDAAGRSEILPPVHTGGEDGSGPRQLLEITIRANDELKARTSGR